MTKPCPACVPLGATGAVKRDTHRSYRSGKNTPANESTGRGVVAAKHDVD